MAKLVDQTLTIKFSKLVRDDKYDPSEKLVNDELLQKVEESLQNLVSDIILVEAGYQNNTGA